MRADGRAIPTAAAGATAIVVLLVAVAFDRTANDRHREEVRADVVRDLSAVRAVAENAINSRVNLTLGLRAYVSVNPDMTRDEFAAMAANLMEEAEGIRSVTSIRDNVIDDVYPFEPNKGAIGLDLLADPQQRAEALRAIESGKSWLAGPVELKQGGRAFIDRAPVHVTEPGGEPGGGRYWGMVSILVNLDTIVDEITEGVPDDLNVAVRGRTAGGEPGVLFIGTEEILATDPIETEIALPTGGWKLYGVPRGGWPRSAPGSGPRLALGVVLATITGSLVFAVVMGMLRYRESTRRLELAHGEARTAQRTAETARESLAEKAAELERSNADLELFAGAASHDLKAPLRNIGVLLEWVVEDVGANLSDESREHVVLVQDALNRMNRLLDDLLDYSRVGRRKDEVQEVDCSVLVGDVVTLLAPREGIVVDVPDDLPQVVSPVPPLRQVFQNLIGNAVKYHDCPTGRIEVRAEIVGDFVEFCVADDGPGIPKEHHEVIFEAFRTLDVSSTRGTGLGLALVKRVVDVFGGELVVESEGRGTTFRFTWPRDVRRSSSPE